MIANYENWRDSMHDRPEPDPRELGELIAELVKWLPKDEHRIWSPDGDEILCETEQLAEDIADFIDALYGIPVANTGYYDPEEDARNGETNQWTGYYYVTIN